MDRTIPKEVQQRKRRLRLLMWGGGIAGVFALVVAGAVFLRPSVSRGGITLSTVDVGTLEISINASGTVEPAYEEIINSPIELELSQCYIIHILNSSICIYYNCYLCLYCEYFL